jgi:8-oxo-dGTP pyrophosphatase MutT (NUDIX family)
MAKVECITLDGDIRLIPASELIVRPAAYALIFQGGKILLLRMKQTGKYHLPGGGVKVDERIEQALKRETREETGIEIDVGKLAHFHELFFYYDPSGRAYHGFHFYYYCSARTTDLIQDDQVKDGSTGQPRWVAIQGLRADEFQSEGQAILDICRAYLAGEAGGIG